MNHVQSIWVFQLVVWFWFWLCGKYICHGNSTLLTNISFLGLPYAEKTADYYNDDYNYSSDDYPNGDGDDNTNTYPSETEKIIHRTPVMKSKNSDELINEGNIIRLSCVVDNIGMSALCI